MEDRGYQYGQRVETQQLEPILTDVQPPFDSSAKSDVVLRYSDNLGFYVLKLLLSLFSHRCRYCWTVHWAEAVGHLYSRIFGEVEARL